MKRDSGLPIVCPACRKAFHQTVEQLKIGTNTCIYCKHVIKATKEFLEVMGGGEGK